VNNTSPASPKKSTTNEDAAKLDITSVCLSINFQFLHLANCLQQMIDSEKFLLNCDKVMVSTICYIPLFDYVNHENFKKCISKCNSTIFLQSLSLLWTWTDYSILNELLTNAGYNDAATVLLEKFNSHSKNLAHKKISEFPLPSPSSKMIPDDVSKKYMHTVLAIKYKRIPDECTLKDVFDVRQKVMMNCDVSENAMQFLAVANNHSKFTILYWFICNDVIPLLNTKIFENSSCLHKENIFELAIYPGLHFTTDGHPSLSFGPLAFLMTPPNGGFKVCVCIYAEN